VKIVMSSAEAADLSWRLQAVLNELWRRRGFLAFHI
jgi:hypothetical protein